MRAVPAGDVEPALRQGGDRLVEIRTDAERTIRGSGEDRGCDGGSVANLGERLGELVVHRQGERIQFLRSIEADDRDRTVAFERDTHIRPPRCDAASRCRPSIDPAAHEAAYRYADRPSVQDLVVAPASRQDGSAVRTSPAIRSLGSP